MKNWFGILSSVLLIYPQLYPGYLMPEEKQNLGPVRLGLGAGWILLFICIPVLLLVFIIFWRRVWSHNRKKIDY